MKLCFAYANYLNKTALNIYCLLIYILNKYWLNKLTKLMRLVSLYT